MKTRPKRKSTADYYKDPCLINRPDRIRTLAEVEEGFALIRHKLIALEKDDCEYDRLLDHIRSLARFRAEPMDYDEDNVEIPEFPAEVLIAYAICHPECGMKEFIVDGST